MLNNILRSFSFKRKQMKFGENGIKLLKTWEALRLKPYNDKTGKPTNRWSRYATVGYGYLIPEEEWHLYKNGISKERAEELYQRKLKEFIGVVNKLVKVKLNQDQFDALVILTYNIGPSGFSDSSVLKMINDPEYKSSSFENLEQAWKAWNKQDGKVVNGLVNRRKKEWKLYTGEYNG